MNARGVSITWRRSTPDCVGLRTLVALTAQITICPAQGLARLPRGARPRAAEEDPCTVAGRGRADAGAASRVRLAGLSSRTGAEVGGTGMGGRAGTAQGYGGRGAKIERSRRAGRRRRRRRRAEQLWRAGCDHAAPELIVERDRRQRRLRA